MGKIALKHVLKNFLNHFETLESRRKLNHDDNLYAKEFRSLKELTEILKKDIDYSCSHGLQDVNRKKNRYKDILPYDYSRVILSDYPGVPGSDYINANYVKGSTGSTCAYIASQGPLPNTVVDFWRMIWECEVTVIVMACNETESGKYKCEGYWAVSTDQSQQYGNITVTLVKWKQVCPDFLVRTLKIKSEDEERIVCQFHYTTWPDHGVPNSVAPILELVRLIRDVQASEARPILVHCSAGCGRTGTICSIDYVWTLLRTGKLTEDFSLYTIISDMRRQRIAMVQTQEQYVLCYRAVATLFEQQLKMIDAHTYENLNEDGEPLINSEEDCTKKSLTSLSSDETDFNNDCMVYATLRNPKKHTFGSLRVSKMHKSSPNFELDGFYQTNDQLLNETRQERLVGKATVIRRPSIARLKAMFENIQTMDTKPNCSYRNKKTLQRSMSTREKNTHNSNWEDGHMERTFANHGSFENLSINNIQPNNEITWNGNSNNKCNNDKQTNSLITDDDLEKSTNFSKSIKNLEDLDDKKELLSFTSMITHSKNLDKKSSNLMMKRRGKIPEKIEMPPPKPPRTYQHTLGLNVSPDHYNVINFNENDNKFTNIKLPNSPSIYYNTIDSAKSNESNYSYNECKKNTLSAKIYSLGQSKSSFNIADQNNFEKDQPVYDTVITRSWSTTLQPNSSLATTNANIETQISDLNNCNSLSNQIYAPISIYKNQLSQINTNNETRLANFNTDSAIESKLNPSFENPFEQMKLNELQNFHSDQQIVSANQINILKNNLPTNCTNNNLAFMKNQLSVLKVFPNQSVIQKSLQTNSDK